MNVLKKYISKCAGDTFLLGQKIAPLVKNGGVIAMFGSMGMGKTVFTHGLAAGLGIDPNLVSSPTFALVHEYGEETKLYHFDMYRIETWDDLYSTGFFDYIGSGVLAVEWSENIENALPEDSVRIYFEPGENEDQRIITVYGGAQIENSLD